MHMKRKSLLALAITAAISLSVLGCGGSNTTKTEGTGRLADVDIAPLPGATFIARDSEFTISWASGYEPPASFSARVYQVDGAGEINELTSSLVRDGDQFRWFLRPTSLLPFRSALYVELSAPGQTSLNFSYISGTRSTKVSNSSLHTGGTLAKVHHIQVR